MTGDAGASVLFHRASDNRFLRVYRDGTGIAWIVVGEDDYSTLGMIRAEDAPEFARAVLKAADAPALVLKRVASSDGPLLPFSAGAWSAGIHDDGGIVADVAAPLSSKEAVQLAAALAQLAELTVEDERLSLAKVIREVDDVAVSDADVLAGALLERFTIAERVS